MHRVSRIPKVLVCLLLAVTILSLSGCGWWFKKQQHPGDTPIVIGEGASMKLQSNASFDDGWTYIDADGKPNRDESAIWIHPDVARVIQSVVLTRAGGGTKSENWPSKGRLVVTYGRDQGHGQDVTVVAIALNPASNGLALIQTDLKRKDFDLSGTGDVVLTSKANQHVAQLKKVTLEGAANPVLCDNSTSTACAGGSVKVIFK